MKTQTKIFLEAQRLGQLGEQYWLEHRQTARRGGSSAATRVLFNFPLTPTIDSRRWIEVGLGGEEPEYRLMQGRAETLAGESDDQAFVELSDEDVTEVLREGYAEIEAERLAECLAPIVARLEEVGFCDGMDAALAEVETVAGVSDLPSAMRLRTRADTMAFLEGRMTPSDFITEAVERQYARETACETLVERAGERLAIDEP